MKRSVRILLCLVVVLSIALCVLTACNGDQSVSGYTGKYYEYSYSGEKNPKSWIELKSGNKWTDGDDSGTYSIKDGKISIMQDKQEIMSGSISNGIMILDFWGMRITYKKDGASNNQGNDNNQGGNDDTPTINEYTVTFDLNYGTNNTVKKQTVNKLVNFYPTRDNYTFNGWWISTSTGPNGEPVLGKKWDNSTEVDSNDLVLYAEWVLSATEEGQLPAPTVTIDEYRLSWSDIDNSAGYRLLIYYGGELITDEVIYRTYWTFNQSNDCGAYTIMIRANGNGVVSTNSSYVTKTIYHKYLDSFTSFEYNKDDYSLSWSDVDGATEYELFIDGESVWQSRYNQKSFSVMHLDAGTHSASISARKKGWVSASRSVSFDKLKLKTPTNVKHEFDSENECYIFTWDRVRYADTYKIYDGDKLLKTVDEPTVQILDTDWKSQSQLAMDIYIIAFDSKADRIQSAPTDKYTIDKIVKASVSTNDNSMGTVCISGENVIEQNIDSLQTKVGNIITMTAETMPGYTFIGWFSGNIKVSENYEFSTSATASNNTFKAVWYYSISQNLEEAGSITKLMGKYRPGDEVTVTASTNSGYTFIGWFDGNTKVSSGTSLSFTFTMPDSNKIYTAKWYKIDLTQNINDAGSIIHPDEKYAIGDEATATVTTNAGYTFIGWFDGNTKVSIGTSLSFTFTMSENNKTYIAKWYKINLTQNMDNAGSISMLKGTYVVGDEATVTATTNPGYTWLGWFDGNTKVSENTSLSLTFIMPEENKTYTAKWYNAIGKNIDNAGSISVLKGTYVVGDEVTVTATTNPGYTWLGWFDGNTKVSENTDFSYTFAMPDYIKTYIAKWCITEISKNIETAGSITKLTDAYVVGDEVTVTATTNLGYIWLGWFDGETKVSVGDSTSLTFQMLDNSKTYIAKWKLIEIDSNLVFTLTESDFVITGVKDKTVTSLIIPQEVTRINEGALNGCSKLECLTVPYVGANRNYQSYSFGYIFGTKSYSGSYTAKWTDGYNDVKNFQIPNSLRSVIVTGGVIGYKAFINCSMITNIIIPDNITRIGDLAFANCTSLTSIAIPDSVTSIDGGAFSGCSGLTSITIPASMTSFVTKYAECSFSGCSGLTSITVLPGNSKYHSKGNCLIDTMSKTLVLGCKNSVIPDDGSVTKIGDYAFKDCSGLTSIMIPDSVTSIGYGAFEHCGITNITIPNSVIHIGGGAFNSCGSITNITIPDSVTHIGSHAFEYCNKLTSITFSDTSSWYTIVLSASNASDWENRTGGTYINVNNPATNATNFVKESYYSWYKL